MGVYYHIYDAPEVHSKSRNLIAVCLVEGQAHNTFESLLIEGTKMGLTYLVMERVWTNHNGVVTSVMVIRQAKV